jgi:hypothetical protein
LEKKGESFFPGKNPKREKIKTLFFLHLTSAPDIEHDDVARVERRALLRRRQKQDVPSVEPWLHRARKDDDDLEKRKEERSEKESEGECRVVFLFTSPFFPSKKTTARPTHRRLRAREEDQRLPDHQRRGDDEACRLVKRGEREGKRKVRVREVVKEGRGGGRTNERSIDVLRHHLKLFPHLG